MAVNDSPTPTYCDACGTTVGPLMKLSLGKDFFGRPYDRLSPSLDQRPKWYCEMCSAHKNFQRDVRDIEAELAKRNAGKSSEISGTEGLTRSQARLKEIVALLGGSGVDSPFLDLNEVTALSRDFDARHPSDSRDPQVQKT